MAVEILRLLIYRTLLTSQEANRRKAKERLQRREPLQQGTLGAGATIGAPGSLQEPRRPRMELTESQKQRIEQNRKRAVEILQKGNENHRDARNDKGSGVDRDNGSIESKKRRFHASKPMTRKQDYIEYDFSTMKDTRGGFINSDEPPKEFSADSNETSFKEWQEKQERKLQVVRDPAPPLDIANAPKCYECNSLEIDHNLYKTFNARVCRKCARKMPEKYSLLTKTECKEDYLLTEPELKDTKLLPHLEKANPHGFSRMQLFLRFQVEEFAWIKWGSPEGLDQEWERREAMKLDRRDKKYADKLREMRKNTRAEEYTRKLRNGFSLGERHVHYWSAPLAIPGSSSAVKKRCLDCGLETEEVLM